MYSIEDDARDYLSRQLKGMDVSSVPFEAVKSCVAQTYEGGWVAYEADFNRVMSLREKPTPVLTPFQLWAKLPNIVETPRSYFLLRPHSEVISVDIGDDEIKAVLRIAKVDERAQRDRISYGAKLIVWKRDEDGWWSYTPESITVWGSEYEELVRWGRVKTAEWVASQREQYETCYRPGTEKTPMQGPAARLGVSREEFHKIGKGQ